MQSPKNKEGIAPPEDVPSDEKSFHVLRTLGQGAFGIVYLAEDLETNELVAIKTVENTPDDDKSFLIEMLFYRTCRHPNILACRGCYRLSASEKWIVLDYMDVGCVGDLIRTHEKGILPENVIASIVEAMLKGLSYLHKNKKIHRDIKAANVLLDSSGRCKLADFGVSKQLDSTLDLGKTFCGTFTHMAPEQMAYKGKEGYDAKVDIWAVGVMVHELATGFTVYQDIIEKYDQSCASNRMGFMRAQQEICEGLKINVSKFTNLSEELIDFLQKCLEYEPNEIAKHRAKNRPSADDLLKHPFLAKSLGETFLKDYIEPFIPVISKLRELDAKEEEEAQQAQAEQEEFNCSSQSSIVSGRVSFRTSGVDIPELCAGTFIDKRKCDTSGDMAYSFNSTADTSIRGKFNTRDNAGSNAMSVDEDDERCSVKKAARSELMEFASLWTISDLKVEIAELHIRICNGIKEDEEDDEDADEPECFKILNNREQLDVLRRLFEDRNPAARSSFQYGDHL